MKTQIKKMTNEAMNRLNNNEFKKSFLIQLEQRESRIGGYSDNLILI